MKSQIAQFVQDNGRTTKDFSVNVSRVHPAILSMIYEYLKWVGMKNTCALLLCESPVQFETNNADALIGNSSAVPELCTYLSEKLAQTEKSRLSETLGSGHFEKNVEQANKISSKSSGEPPEGQKDSMNNQTEPSSNCNSVTSDLSESESFSKSDRKDKNVYSKQYEKNVSDNLKKNQGNPKLEKELKASNSDQSVQQNVNKENKHYVFMTEKQKMEALNMKLTNDEPVKSPPFDSITKQSESEQSSRISNPGKKPTSFEPDFEDESISDLNGSTAEDVTQDLSMDSDSKLLAECEHLMVLKSNYPHIQIYKITKQCLFSAQGALKVSPPNQLLNQTTALTKEHLLAVMAADTVSAIKNILNDIGNSHNDDKKRKDLLESLRTALAHFSRAELEENVDQLPLEVLFDCLGEETESTCVILKDLMMVSDPLKNLEKYHEYMLQGFQHPSDEVRVLVIAQLRRFVEIGGNALNILCADHQDLLIAALKQQGGEDLGVAKQSGLFLTKLAGTDRGFDFALGRVGTDTLKQLVNDEGARGAVKFRVYETLCNVANISEKHLEAIQNNIKLIEPLNHLAFESDDPLGQLNALEILAVLSETPHGLQALSNANVFTKVIQLAKDWQNNPLGSLLFPGLIKFVGRIGVQRLPPEELVLLVLDAITNSGEDIPLATVGIEALAFIGSTQEGKLHLDKEHRLRKCFERTREILSNAVSEYRCRVLEALSYLFGSDEAHTPCLPRWFGLVFPQISVLFDLAQLPFADIRLKALTFLSSIAHLEWAQKHYLRSPGVIEYLTDRNIEPDKDCALAKFKIVSIIIDSTTPTTLKILSPENLARLRVHVKQGPFYAPAQSTVAFEGAS
ncbi:unnamed protein product [Allacma fusca]|uniref:26S proteasome non-ATPase regulatory subunit 5 n=1 Tax=Allacma fusca TaxID=39272 RepID=A0A8J2KY14_9HEXA|nr:unnamed protein product [Allacma fusca]